MHPILFRIGGLTIHTYGLFVAMGFMAGMALAVREARRAALDTEKISNLFFWIIISAIIGSRLLYVIAEAPGLIMSPFEIFKIWKGGLVFYGGVILAMAVTIFYIRHNKLPLWTTMDILAPPLALGLAFGRLGCFSAGCCYGRPADVPWAVTFTNPDSLAPLYIPLHPTQLYEAGTALIIFAILMLTRRAKRFEGQMMWTFFFLYAVARFIIENYRGDPRGAVWGDLLSTSQFISLLSAVAALAGFFYFLRKQGARQGGT
ncbi:MAG: prolipoprotein diacylglyceryl transferase [Desulfovibrionales bacterium]|nr:prolipoprotein diacylglyceryl transferase [Desulfovibrionales bacterium]